MYLCGNCKGGEHETHAVNSLVEFFKESDMNQFTNNIKNIEKE